MKTRNLIIIMIILAVGLATTTGMGADLSTLPIGGDEGYYAITSSPSGAMASVDGTNVGSNTNNSNGVCNRNARAYDNGNNGWVPALVQVLPG